MIALPTNLNVIPRPTDFWLGDGTIALQKAVCVEAPDCFAFEIEQLAEILAKAGVPMSVKGDPVDGSVSIALRQEAGDAPGHGKEGYSLEIGERGIEIGAADAAGAYYAIQTLRQMLPATAEAGMAGGSLRLRHVRIIDRPKFPWRGLLFDVSRHFFTVDEIKSILDLLAFHKMNVLHWHLVDDGGWRIEIKRYPNLVDQGAWRSKKEFVWDYLDIDFPGPGTDLPLYGGYYTHEQIREVIQYAAQRHVNVLPEIEMPGHSLAALWSYPELACTPEAAEVFKAEVGMRFPNVFCAGKEESFDFLENVLDEVIELFPSKYIHVGGDEVFKVLWENCSRCQQRMRDEGLATVDDLQSYFIRRIERHINAHGRILIGWDEILQGGLAPNAVVMSWRGMQGGIEAARAGHDVVMTPYSHCYFDFGYDKTPTEHVLNFEPIPEGLTREEARHILGGQANLWTEYVPDLATVHRMTLPRLASMAEVLWSGKPELADFAKRLRSYRERLRHLGLQQNDEQEPQSS